MTPRPKNLWAEMLRDYWSDPRNVIGPPGALVRRITKFLWIVLTIYVLFWVAAPSQVASWRLWMRDEQLAQDLAWAFTFASALCFAIVGYVADGTSPVRVPVPFLEFEGSIRNVKVHTTHMHLPNVRVLLGSLFALGLFFMSLLGMWNYYLHENIATGSTSVAAIQGSTSRVTEAEAALADHQRSTREALAQIDRAIADTPDGSPTGRSRLVNQRTQLMTQAATETARLREELRVARETTVEVSATATDPRPVDGIVAAATGLDRGVVASTLDLMRSAVVEALLILGLGLGLAKAVERAPVAREEEGVVAPTPVETPQEQPPPPPPKRRFVLPTATAEDYAEAFVVGPRAPPPPASPAETAEQSAPAGAQEPLLDTAALIRGDSLPPTPDRSDADYGDIEENDPLVMERMNA